MFQSVIAASRCAIAYQTTARRGTVYPPVGLGGLWSDASSSKGSAAGHLSCAGDDRQCVRLDRDQINADRLVRRPGSV